jgi:hypothetical protein
LNKEEQNAAESLLLQDVLDDSELGCIESCTEDKASNPMKEDRGKKWSKEDKMVIKKLFHLFEYVFIHLFFNLCRLEKEKIQRRKYKKNN